VGTGFTHSLARFSFAKTKISQASNRPRRDICLACARPSAVSGPIRVPKAQAARSALLDKQFSTVTRAMVCAAQREQVGGLMVASVSSRAEMMHVDEDGVPTTRYLAAMLIAPQHRATNGRRNRL
jgi:hypothetical protein